jgi:hypothetical protein
MLRCTEVSQPTDGMGHSRPMHSVPVPINVRCYSNSDIIVRRREMTLRADAVEKVGLPGGVMLFGSFDPAETSRLLGFAAA